MSVPHSFGHHSFVVSLKSGIMKPPTWFPFFFKMLMDILYSIWILRYIFLFLQTQHWDFGRDFTESIDCFWYYWHFNNIMSSHLWTGMSFHLLIPSLTIFKIFSSFQCKNHLSPRPKFVLFNATANEIIFLISFWDYSLLVFRMKLILVCSLCILQLCWVLQYCFIAC
jgi:hypothetical protein